MMVQVPVEQISAQVKEKLGELMRSVRIDGFRPGKAPFVVVQRQFGERVRNDVLGDLLRKSFSDALQSNDLRPVAEPVFDPVSADIGSGLSYTATFEVYPEVKLTALNELSIKRPVCEISDADVDAMLEVLRRQHATWEETPRAAAMGDRLIVDFAGTVDGEALERGSATDHEMDLGAANMIDGFESGLVGASAGDVRTLDLHFPTPYSREDLAGKAVKFVVTVKQVKERRLPELNDELFAKFGVTEGGLEAFRKEVSENMSRERDRAVLRNFNRGVMETLSAAHELALPVTLIAVEARRMHDESRRNLSMRGVDPDRVGHPGPEAFGVQARERVKRGLLMAEVVRTSGVQATPAKVRSMVESLAASYEEPEALMRWYYGEPERLQEIEAMCVEEEAVNWLVAQANVADEPISFDDLMNPGQTRSQEQSPA
jgi:trigger factor